MGQVAEGIATSGSNPDSTSSIFAVPLPCTIPGPQLLLFSMYIAPPGGVPLFPHAK